MPIQKISIDDIIINPNNDRHGPTSSQEDAIQWLFENKPNEMVNLAKRIVDDGRIFDAPLAVNDGNKFLLKDGNRRVTCLKLIHDPKLAPKKFRKLFSSLSNERPASLSKHIECQVENDLGVADQIIYLRHSGTQGGIGQLNWGPTEKANHANRVSGRSDYEWPQLVEQALENGGHADEAKMIKRSTLDRILKVKKRREALGLEVDGNHKLVSTDPKRPILPLLRKLAHDMDQGKLTLKNTLVAADIDSYFKELQAQGFDTDFERRPNTKNTQQLSSRTKAQRKRNSRTSRETLIPQSTDYDFDWIDRQGKIELAFQQLQYELNFKNHKFSISIVFRTLLEMTCKGYLNKIGNSKEQTLLKAVKSTSEGLRDSNVLEKKDCADIVRAASDEKSTLSVTNLQRIVHSTTLVPSDDDLRSMWECYEPIIVGAIKAVQKKQ